MIIKDIKGGKLRLGKTTLTEMTGETLPGELWQLKLKDLANVRYRCRVPLVCVHSDLGKSIVGLGGEILYIPRVYRIGCRTFDAATFAHIKNAVRALHTPMKELV